ncbi:flagellar biosynthetic protein FliO [Hahella ganghwensis]|uniref:flagellar biosynthetic protein FliO n=1 Tax=Hahella ganghwensis TaxID=286420 RepID=UPI0003640B4F|nr:flagellar biosynthetic protein FliO [Hahella ganghwensis]
MLLKPVKLLSHGLVWLGVSVTALAAEKAEKAPVPVTGVEGGQIMQIFGALILVVLMILGIAWFSKRFTGLTPQNNQNLKTVAVLPVGSRERIALVQVGDRQILVGITPQQISTLYVLDEPLDLSQPGGEFARKLQSLLRRNENEAEGEANGTQ